MLYDPTIFSAFSVLELATKNAACLFPKNVYTGIIKHNSPADLSIIDLGCINTTPIINPISNWIFSSSGSNIILTMSNGMVLYKDRKFLTLDIIKTKNEAQKATDEMIDKSGYSPK